MTQFIVAITNPTEVATALEGGADRLFFIPGSADAPTAQRHDVIVSAAGTPVWMAISEALASSALGREAELAGFEAMVLPPSMNEGVASGCRWMAKECPRRIAWIATEAPPRAELQGLKGKGFAGVLLAPPTGENRLLDHRSPAVLARFVKACRQAGLISVLAGALEPPDVPRLLALAPDMILWSGRWRGEDRGRGPDGTALAQMRRLVRSAASAEREGEEVATDVVFVRDHVVDMTVGAYSHERGMRQRVRFSVEAEVIRHPREPRDMADVFSYDIITDAIGRLAEAGHLEFVEAMAERLAADVLADQRVKRVMVRVEKLDLGSGAAGIEIRRSAAPG
ncbi:dihydroneopterin aldolase [Consotaella salsifontis]|uniref:(5-formylfuran-3-yl)methyl phosphate synthase n=1 Tax=Consotaella salsifontis TaxID=1365950 RepID=A0A1T4SRH6_9HYPH|nr:dihydroneopterin aldolase [Consotaella salsifontis]SKA30835.1 dihydroneopterin aldolase [Consotaella salsifontis]